MYKYLKLEKKDSIGKITFNRPENLNAMNRIFMEEIIVAIEEINSDTTVKIAIITGEGKAFMAGADIKEYAAQTKEEFNSFQRLGWSLYSGIEKSSKVYIAAVNGYALGGGFEILLACDLVIAKETALLGLPEVHLALIPGGGGTQRLTQKIGLNRAKELLYFGQQYTAKEMKDWGIVNYIFSENNFVGEVEKIATKLVRKNTKSLEYLKNLVQLSMTENPFDERLKAEGEAVYKLFLRDEAKQKIAEFMNKK